MTLFSCIPKVPPEMFLNGIFFQTGTCSVYIPEDERVITIPNAHLEPVMPSKSDRVSTKHSDYAPCQNVSRNMALYMLT